MKMKLGECNAKKVLFIHLSQYYIVVILCCIFARRGGGSVRNKRKLFRYGQNFCCINSGFYKNILIFTNII